MEWFPAITAESADGDWELIGRVDGGSGSIMPARAGGMGIRHDSAVLEGDSAG